MQNKSTVVICLSILCLAFLFSGCAGWQRPSESNFKTPTVALSHVELQHYFGYWYYDAKIKPTMGNPGKNGAPLDYAFIFEITNPNAYPVQLESLSFSIAFEDFALNRAISPETMWIPPEKTNQLRVHAVFDVNPAMTSLAITGGLQLKEKGMSAPQAIEKWWTGAPDFSFPVHVTEGSAVFNADGVVKVAAFEATFP
jgi:hypothetical protein